MKRIILAALVGLYLPSVLGSADIKAEFSQFLKEGDVVSLLNSAEAGNALVEKVKVWVTGFTTPQEFGAYFNPDDVDQTTLLGKLVKSNDERTVGIIDYLTAECGVQFDAGPAGKTPQDFLKEGPLKKELEVLRLLYLVRGYIEGKNSSSDVIQHVERTKIAIDEAKFPYGQSVKDYVLVHAKTKPVGDILAYCAPYMHDQYDAFSCLVGTSLKFTEDKVPLKLVKDYLAAHPDLETQHLSESFHRIFENKLSDVFSDENLKNGRVKEVHGVVQKYFALTKGSNSTHPQVLWVTSEASDAEITKLLVDCAKDDRRDAELASYLAKRKDPLYIASKHHGPHGTLEDYFVKLSLHDYPRKDTIIAQLNEHLFEHLVSIDTASDAFEKAMTDFVAHLLKHNLHIDSMKYHDSTIGKFVDANAETAVGKRLHAYRADHLQATSFLTALDKALKGEDADVEALEAFLDDKALNVDRIGTHDGKKTVATYLAEHAGGMALLDLPAIRSYRDDALAYKELLEKALNDKAHMDALKDLCDYNAFDVDTLLYTPGKTVGEFITEQIGTANRENALKIAQLVQENRTEKEEIVRTLFKSVEVGGTTDELKAWCAAFPTLDLNSITYDPADSTNADTIGSVIDAKYAALAKDLGRITIPQAPVKGKPTTTEWSMGKKLGGLALLAGVGIGYYYYTHKASKAQAKDPKAVTAD